MKSNKQYIDEFGEDDMPCLCEVCHEWFDLYDGLAHPRKENLIICASCSNAIQLEVDREEEIEELQCQISDAEYTIKDARERLVKLEVESKEDNKAFGEQDMKCCWEAARDYGRTQYLNFEEWLKSYTSKSE